MEDNSSMPSLQDMLGDFDLSGLEEFAESLLADVTTELEDNFAASRNGVAKAESTAIGVLERMVGTTTEQLESSKDTGRSINHIADDKRHSNTIAPQITSHPKLTINQPTPPTQSPTPESDNQTLYGTYDEKTNSITIVYPDESIPISDAIEEIICDTSSSSSNLSSYGEADDVILPSINDNEYLNLTQDLNLLSPLPKSLASYDKSPNHSVISDSGYESLGSPIDDNFNELWNTSFSELFPSLA